MNRCHSRNRPWILRFEVEEGCNPIAEYVATDPDAGMCFASCPILEAVKRIPIKAKSTASGRAPPASGEPNGMEAAIAAPGAIEQMD